MAWVWIIVGLTLFNAVWVFGRAVDGTPAKTSSRGERMATALISGALAGMAIRDLVSA